MEKVKRRKFLIGMGVAAPQAMQWQKPIVNAVITPVHAQMSVCTTQDVVGVWDVFHEDSEIISSYDLFEDGSGADLDPKYSEKATVTWILYDEGSGIKIYVSLESEVLEIVGLFGNNCSEFSGVEGLGKDPVSAKKGLD